MKLRLDRRSIWILLVVQALILGLLIFVYANRPTSRGMSKPSDELPSYGEVVDFALTDQQSEPFSKSDMLNKVWLVNFIFTRCPSMCPTMSLQFQLLGKTLPKGINLLSVSVDPEYDTPTILKSYASKYTEGTRLPWTFLTGPQSIVDDFIKSCHIGTDKDPNMHSLRFVLIDDKAQIRGYYDSTDKDSMNKIKQDIKKLL